MRKPKVVRLRASKVPDDDVFIQTLVWILDRARKGKIKGYAMVYVVENDDGVKTVEGAKSFEDCDRLHVLGAIRRMEANYMKREWPDDD